MLKILLGLAATAAIATPLAMASSASAANGEELIQGGDFAGITQLDDTATDFTWTDDTFKPYGTPGMYDPGMYTIASNPASVHEAWISLPEGDPMMIVNGFQNTDQKVWSQTIAGPTCTTPGSKVTFDFTVNAMNILRTDWNGGGNAGANISVKVNGTEIGHQDLTSNDPGQIVQFVAPVPAAEQMEVTIWNNGTAFTGNDFAIDDISLVQRGECELPCQHVVNGVWHNYTGKFTGTGTPSLNDPKWKALPAHPGGQHDVTLRGFDEPYQPGVDKGKGDWFVWKDLGTTCPA